MGGQQSTLEREELEVYESCTCLSGAEILELLQKFEEMGGMRVSEVDSEKMVKGTGSHLRLSVQPPAPAGDTETGAAGPPGGSSSWCASARGCAR